MVVEKTGSYCSAERRPCIFNKVFTSAKIALMELKMAISKITVFEHDFGEERPSTIIYLKKIIDPLEPVIKLTAVAPLFLSSTVIK